MIIVTGGAGFIGSNLVNALVKRSEEVVLCDFSHAILKNKYIEKSHKIKFIEPNTLITFLLENPVKLVYHLGAISSTTFSNGNQLWLNNTIFTMNIWRICCIKEIKMIYASSAATYGDGKNGFYDTTNLDYLNNLKPLNLYGWSKHQVDIRICYSYERLRTFPPQWIGIKFFNVFGPNEEHKSDMISVALKTFNQILEKKTTKLFKSANSDYEHGEQRRDFIYVKDCIKILLWFGDNNKLNGLFNVGTGFSRTFYDLVSSVYRVMNKNINLKYIDMPKSIENQYQYDTKAEISNLHKSGYTEKFFSLEEGVHDYIHSYLLKKKNAISKY